MQSKVAPFAATPDPTFGRQAAPTAPEKGAAGAPATAGVDAVDLRLVIVEDQASGTYVYKTIDRRTGEVIQQLPREEVLKLHEDIAYVAGGVIRTKA